MRANDKGSGDGDGEGGEGDVDACYAVVRVVVGVLDCAADYGDDDVHAVYF